jgi:hypothetical protein
VISREALEVALRRDFLLDSSWTTAPHTYAASPPTPEAPILSTPVDSRLNRCCLQRRVDIVGLEYGGERGQYGAADRRNRNAGVRTSGVRKEDSGGVDGIGGRDREQHIHQGEAGDEDSRRGLQCVTCCACARYQHPAAPSSRPANRRLWQAEEDVQPSSCKRSPNLNSELGMFLLHN